MSSLPQRATLVRIAQAAGLSERTVRRHAKEAGIERGADGLYPSRRVLDAIIAHQGRDKSAGAVAPEVARARAEKIRLEAELLKVRLMRERGTLVLAEEVKLAWQSMVGTMRARLLGLPQAAAPLVAVEGDAAECARILEKMVREALDELAGDGLPSTAEELLDQGRAQAEPAPEPAQPKRTKAKKARKKATNGRRPKEKANT